MRNKIEYIRTEINNVFERYIEKLNAQPKGDLITDNSHQAFKSIGEHLKAQKESVESNKGNRFKEMSTLTETE